MEAIKQAKYTLNKNQLPLDFVILPMSSRHRIILKNLLCDFPEVYSIHLIANKNKCWPGQRLYIVIDDDMQYWRCRYLTILLQRLLDYKSSPLLWPIMAKISKHV